MLTTEMYFKDMSITPFASTRTHAVDDENDAVWRKSAAVGRQERHDSPTEPVEPERKIKNRKVWRDKGTRCRIRVCKKEL